MFGCKVSAARLDSQAFHINFHFKRMIVAVQFQILRRKAQQVRVFRRGRRAREGRVHIVVVLKEDAVGAIRQFGQYVRFHQGGVARVLLLDPSGIGVPADFTGVGSSAGGVKTARVDRVDGHAGPYRCVDDQGNFVL